MKTTIDLRDDPLKAAQKVAIDRGGPLRALVEAALERETSADGEDASTESRRRELGERLESARLAFEASVATGQLPEESSADARLRLLPLPAFHDGDAELSLHVSEVVAAAIRLRE